MTRQSMPDMRRQAAGPLVFLFAVLLVTFWASVLYVAVHVIRKFW